LYDGIGSLFLGKRYVAELRGAGVKVQAFLDYEGRANRYQLNFRNHRKLVVVDGKVAFIGGHNVGDEYVNEHPEHTPWRDLALRMRGPIVKFVQVPFVEDWHWATCELLEDLEWSVTAEARTAGVDAVCIPSGPGDAVETCSMMFLTAINDARERLWIASPYFVPDEQIVTALQMAALRGVDVRVLIPEESDNTLVHLSSYSYLAEMEAVGVAIMRYHDGFLHRKALLVDDDLVAIGSANLDNRSFRLNFEVTVFVRDQALNANLARVFETDFVSSRRARLTDLTERSFPFRLAVRVARLMAPLQ
jgi:cardiolipin synthase